MKIGVFLFLLLTGVNSLAGVTKWVDANGEIHYSDQPPPSGVKATDLLIHKKPIDSQQSVNTDLANKPSNLVKDDGHQLDVNDINAVPYLKNKDGYKSYLSQKNPKAFVLTKRGNDSYTVLGALHSMDKAMEECKKQHDDCIPYAEDDSVVWKPN